MAWADTSTPKQDSVTKESGAMTYGMAEDSTLSLLNKSLSKELGRTGY